LSYLEVDFKQLIDKIQHPPLLGVFQRCSARHIHNTAYDTSFIQEEWHKENTNTESTTCKTDVTVISTTYTHTYMQPTAQLFFDRHFFLHFLQSINQSINHRK